LRVVFTERGWEDYLHWQATDKRITQRINDMIRELQRTPFAGAGNPEPLRHELAGYWSRRIVREHRLVYVVQGDSVVIAQLRYHY
jgi:toxin YoeB